MEFLYRAGDERRRSRSPSPPSAAPFPPPGSADVQMAAGADAEEVRRQELKASIRDRILREETVERWELEIEVRRELVEQFRRGSLLPAGGAAEQPAAPPAAKSIAANSSFEVTQTNSKAKPPAACLPKRKSHVDAAASTATSSKKQKVSLSCAVCGITANAEKAMQDHLNGKNHKRKAAALAVAAQAQPTAAEPKPEPTSEEEDAVFTAAPSGDFKATRITMLTNSGALEQVTQMDDYVLCEVCNVRTADRVTMRCHLDGKNHISKAQQHKKRQQATGEAPAGMEHVMNGQAAPAANASTAVAAAGDSDTVVLVVDGEPHAVRRDGGFLLCERCGVKAPSESGMRSHLLGKKHKNNKANANSVVPADDVANGEKEATKSQLVDKVTAVVIDETAAQMQAPLAEPMDGKRSELKETTQTLAKEDKVTMECSKTQATEAEKVSAGPAAVDAVGDTDLAMEVDGVRHPLRRVDCFLLCPCCDVKAPSDTVMRSHLVGKKHKSKMASTARTAEVDGFGGKGSSGVAAKGSSVATTFAQVEGNVSKTAKANGEAASETPVTMEAKTAAGTIDAVTPMAVDAPAHVEAVVTAAEAGKGCVTQANGSVKTADATEPGKPMKIMVEGKLFIVMQQENGRFTCKLCAVHGYKDDMLKHMYTRMHWDNANLAEKELAAKAAAAAVVKGDHSGRPADERTAQVEN